MTHWHRNRLRGPSCLLEREERGGGREKKEALSRTMLRYFTRGSDFRVTKRSRWNLLSYYYFFFFSLFFFSSGIFRRRIFFGGNYRRFEERLFFFSSSSSPFFLCFAKCLKSFFCGFSFFSFRRKKIRGFVSFLQNCWREITGLLSYPFLLNIWEKSRLSPFIP